MIFISFLLNVAGFAETLSWPTTSSTVALICHRRNFSRRQRSEIFEDTTSSCATVVFAYFGGKQHSLRLPISWNRLPVEIVNAPTFNTFKRLLDLAWFSMFPSLTPMLLQLLLYIF